MKTLKGVEKFKKKQAYLEMQPRISTDLKEQKFRN
jgi:hypothetical protein